VQVRVPFAGTEDGWPVPVPAVVRQDDKAYVFVRTAQGFVAQPVTVLDSAGQALRIKGTLRPGQEIAIDLGDRAEVRLARQGREQLTC
jgi:cobalt-zinc-cadmium efflux system membrane fusion protein